MAQESILFPNDPPQEGDQFPIGNTTYAWDPTPGVWRAFTTATSSSGGGAAGTVPVGALAGLSNHTEETVGPNVTFTNDTGTTLYGKIGGLVGGNGARIEITGAGAWVYRGPYRNQGQRSDSGLAPVFAQATDDAAVIIAVTGGSNTDGPFGWDGELFLPPGATARPISPVSFTFWYGSVVGATGGATVNIGGGAGLQLGVTAKDTITTSTTITADDLTGTGPAWVLLGGGGGSGAVAQYNRVNNPSGSAGAGGAGGNYGFFINDSANLVGASFTAGASGTAQTSGAQNVGDGTTVIFGSNGTAGTTSTLVLDGTTYTCTGGGGGTRGTPGTAGAAGTASATGGTPLDLIDVQTINTDIDTYWDGFIVVETGGNLRLGGNTADAAITGSGGGAGDAAFASPQGPDGEGPVREVTSGSGSAGSLQIVYQNQA